MAMQVPNGLSPTVEWPWCQSDSGLAVYEDPRVVAGESIVSGVAALGLIMIMLSARIGALLGLSSAGRIEDRLRGNTRAGSHGASIEAAKDLVGVSAPH